MAVGIRGETALGSGRGRALGNRVARPEGAGPRAGPVAMATGNSFREARPRNRHTRVHPVVRMRTLRAQPGAASDGRGAVRACAGPFLAARQNGGGCWREAVCVFIYLYVRVPCSSQGCAKVLCSCFFFFSSSFCYSPFFWGSYVCVCLTSGCPSVATPLLNK